MYMCQTLFTDKKRGIIIFCPEVEWAAFSDTREFTNHDGNGNGNVTEQKI